MSDPTALAAVAAAGPQGAAASAATSAANQSAINQAASTQSAAVQNGPAANAALPATETRMFATLMKGATVAAPGAGATGGFGAVSTSFVEQWSNTRSFEDIRHSMLQSFDAGDPIKSMFAMTSNAMEAQMLFSKLHISTSLASAATSLFGGLLKNQQ
jgi:hypothetical protein